MKSKGVTAETKNPIKPIGKTGASSGLNLGVRGRASVSSGAKGKAIVSDNAGKVITFKDVTVRSVSLRIGSVSMDSESSMLLPT
ncbi:hypothetical protein Bca52824_048220 [Brassica carinata]|uniref:Uncharacterized protein n=1 Tax=Brassica carinata TaxID=52824 RepID=A0A8X7USZ7_BRACI|nr:hypothetical protein Bca52824_048218 [Brassica carinata]KAG2288616.1 hypothetical protein Bca52824_048220 [Brassica carinata]